MGDKRYIENELSLLEKSVSYTIENSKPINYEYVDESIIDSIAKNSQRQIDANKEFVKVAWGKAIRISSEYEGERIYRLTQSAAIIPHGNIVRPNTSLGRLVNIARAGDHYESDKFGEYSIEDVWYFERYVGREFVENLYNFKSMSSVGINNFLIKNLRSWLNDLEVKISESSVNTEAEEGNKWDSLVFDDIDSSTEEELDEINISPSENKETISLSTRFYVNLTEAQYDVAHFGEKGLVFVFGVAGSGKTSVALGRSKSLSQLSQLEVTNEKYNLAFIEDNQIGIVRTGELISYLKDTCNALSLHNLPVEEYRVIVEELKRHWDIDLLDRSKDKKPKFKLISKDIHKNKSEIKWFNDISKVMIDIYTNKCLSDLKKSKPKNITKIDGNFLLKVNILIHKHISSIIEKQIPVIGLLDNISKSINYSINKIFNESLWVGLESENKDISWYSDMSDNIVDFIKLRSKPLCLFNNLNSVKLLIPSSEVENWTAWIPKESIEINNIEGDIPNIIKVRNKKEEEISMVVIISSDEKILGYLKESKLRTYNGIGEQNLFIRTKEILTVNMLRASNPNDNLNVSRNIVQWRSKTRSVIIKNLQRIFGRLTAYTLYSKAINTLSQQSDDKALIEIKEQIKNNNFSEYDVDILLAFLISITRHLTDDDIIYNRNKLIPAPYRASVFIDEVQDFSEVQVYLLSLISDPKYNSVTAVGDSAQSLYNSESNLKKSFPVELWKTAKVQELEVNVRQQNVPTISALSETYRNWFIDDIPIMTKQYERNENLSIYHESEENKQIDIVYDTVIKVPSNETIVIVVPDIERAKIVTNKIKRLLLENHHKECSYSPTLDLTKKYKVHISTPRNIKGLEFDHLILLYINYYSLSDIKQRNSLYVMVTRPTKELTIIGDISALQPKLITLLKLFADIKT